MAEVCLYVILALGLPYLPEGLAQFIYVITMRQCQKNHIEAPIWIFGVPLCMTMKIDDITHPKCNVILSTTSVTLYEV